MWQTGQTVRKNRHFFIFLLPGLLIAGLLLAACGGASGSATSTNSADMPAQSSGAGNTGGTSQGAQPAPSGKPSSSYGPQYLIKALQINMQVKDTRQVASDLQQWINTTDTHSTSAGMNYQQVGDNLYNVTMSFSVQASLYTQIEEYLAGYAASHSGKLLSLQETVQNSTNDFVDSQSQLKNLRAEQQRLLSFMSQAQNLNDTLTIEQQLTQVEGQINNIEQHLNDLQNQTTFYTITINLQPLTVVAPPPPQPQTPWSPGQVLHDAWSAVVSIWQVLLTFLIWLGVFSLYLVPIGLIAWYIRRRRGHPVFSPAAPKSGPENL